MKPLVITAFFLLGCQVVLEADPDAATDQGASPADARLVDATPDVEPDAGCLPVPPLVRFEDVSVGEVAEAAVPLGCGAGLAVQAARLERVTPPDAFALPDVLPGVPVDHLRLTYHPRLVAEQASAVLVLTSDGDQYAVPIAGSARWTDAACRQWEVAALATGVDGLHRLEASPPAGVAPTAALVQWQVVARPEGSVGSATEDFNPLGPGREPDDPATPGAWILLDIEGLYTIECTVKPPAESGCPLQITRVALERCPCLDDLRVRLTWEAVAGGEAPADLDVHLLHPTAASWGAPGLDCTALDIDPRWVAGALPLERPTHTGNDATAPGFEGIQLARSQEAGALPGPYRVAVENRAQVAVRATIQLFIAERMVWRHTVDLGPDDGWWDVAGIGWHRGALVAAPIDRLLPAGAVPDPWAPLPGGVACLPGQGAPCAEGFVCRDDDGALVGHCRR